MTHQTVSPFADIRQLAVSPPAAGPAPALEQGGRLADIAAWLTAWTGKAPPAVNRPVVALYAGARQGVGPKGWARERLEAIAAGGATVSRLAGAQGAGLEAFDLATDRPSPDLVTQASMSEKEAAATMAFGMEALAKQPDLLIPGVIVAESARTAAAVCLALFGGEAADWSDEPEPVAAAVARAREEGMGDDPLEVLRQLGGRETAAVAGAILAARVQKVPVLLDGYAACAAAAIVQALEPTAIDHCIAAHVSPAKGHAKVLDKLGKQPLLTLGVIEEEGVGGVAALALVKLACEVR